MSLIQCPECGKEISDKAEACIHCGYPIAKLGTCIEKEDGRSEICQVNGQPYNLSEFLKVVLKDAEEKILQKKDPGEQITKTVEELQKLTGLEQGMALALYIYMYREKKIPEVFNDPELRIGSNSNTHSPKCPTCGSGNIKTLGFLERGGWAPKTFGCNNCGYEW